MTTLVPISSIVVPEDRQRKEFKAKPLADLADSIFEHGLLNPVVVRNDGTTLIAGERRFRAISNLIEAGRAYKFEGEWIKDKTIPVTKMHELSPHELAAVEYAENAIRLDLTWQEKSAAMAALHKLRVAEHGEYDRSTGTGQTVKATATEILGIEATGARAQEVADSIALSEFLDDPLVANAPDLKTAKKVVRDLNKAKQRVDAKAAHVAIPHKLILDNCFDADLPRDHYDVIVTDPPYGIDAHTSGTFDNDEHEYDDSKEEFESIIERLPQYTFDLCKPQAHMFLFCDIRRWNYIAEVFRNSLTWWVWPKPLIWYKGNIGSFPHPDHGPRFTYEAILYCIKGKRQQNVLAPDVLHVNQKTQTEHPASKPVELYSELLKRVARPGDKVLDLFAGSGPIFQAASANYCTATGVELNPKYHAMAETSLALAELPDMSIPFGDE